MKNNLFLLIYILPLLIFSQNTDYSGEWTDSSPASTVSSVKIIPGEKFENTLTLEKIKDEENSYKFTFFKPSSEFTAGVLNIFFLVSQNFSTVERRLLLPWWSICSKTSCNQLLLMS